MLISKELILTHVDGDSKVAILESMSQAALKAGKIKDKEAYLTAVLKREEEYSTAVGFAVAIPHGKTDAVVEPFFMYGKVKDIDWKALDSNPVDHVFLIGVPEAEAGNAHLQILAKLSRKLMKKIFVRPFMKPKMLMKYWNC